MHKLTHSFMFVLAFCAAPFLAQAQSTVDLKEWKVPWEKSGPRDPFAENKNTVWFVGQRSGYLARLDVETGHFTKIELEEGSGPHNLIVGQDGIVWYAGNRKALIGRYDPEAKEMQKIAMPNPAARDPHTLVFDGKGHIWFTVQNGNFVGRLNINSHAIDLIPSKTDGSRPYGIKIAADGTVWIVLFGTNKLAKINPKTLTLSEVELPRDEARPRRLEVTSDGRIWYVDYAKGRLGVFNPESENIEEWVIPSGEASRPYGMATDSQGRIWMVASGVDPNLFIGFDPATDTFFSSTPIPSGGRTVRHMHYYEPTGTVWFGTDTNYIGRAIVEPEKADSQ